MTRWLVTGGKGLVGQRLLARLSRSQEGCGAIAARECIGLLRGPVSPEHALPGVRYRICGDLAVIEDWAPFVEGVDILVHSAARVHVMSDTEPDPLAAFRRVNTDGTLKLARAAALAGVRRFIYLSSIKVNGERTAAGQMFTHRDVPAPSDPYAISKREAEDGLREIAATAAMELVIVRPPLVYGPGVQGNFLTMMRWLRRGVPLPFGAIHNRRSLVALDNLVDLLATCGEHPRAPNETFLASDGEDVSTTELLRRTARAMGVRARLLPVPESLLRGAAALAGRGDVATRLFDSLLIDPSHTRQRLSWEPPLSLDEGLALATGEPPRVVNAERSVTELTPRTRSGLH